jgi:transcriptional regulator with XRE-family HTH domain
MDTIRLGRQVRALRRRRGWRQEDLGRAARVSRTLVWRIESGRGDEVALRQLEGVARAMSARLDLFLSWQGEGLDRLLDADHAALVERVATELRRLGWDTVVEASFNIRGERGSVDVLAFYPGTGTVLIVEVKSVVPDIQATLHVLDRKTRLATTIAAGHGWSSTSVGRILVLGEGRTTRRRVATHETIFASSFPHRSATVKRWLASPTPGERFSGLWFLANARQVSARQRVGRHRGRSTGT